LLPSRQKDLRLAPPSRGEWRVRQADLPGSAQHPRAAGMSMLEASTRYETPHAGLRGRGRCGTCRVATLSGEENVPAPSEVEQAILKRIGSAPTGL